MVRFSTAVDDERRAELRQRLRASNTAVSPVLASMRGTDAERELPVDVHALDEEGNLAGGLAGHTWARWLHIDLLWVAESARGKGVGGELVRLAEAVGRDHGCLHARVGTWDFQAPSFYEGLGYTVVAAVPDYPPGVTDFLLTKRLTGGG
ncbi:GNAT family N-acetyltransferase [Streptomyces sp. NPDC026673]|uniref:GNAT family N-acetyltransferase n=1 Tax=Streptomyces sp. NPDC026673 TaxID=3155724 RepID=UPI00340A0D03